MNLPDHIPQTEENIPLLAQLAVKLVYEKVIASSATNLTDETVRFGKYVNYRHRMW